MIYFDYASTAPADPRILELYTSTLREQFANSESHHPLGVEVSKLLERSRRKTAALLRVEPKEILFTSGACEANSLAIKGYALSHRSKGNH
ncbi:MAG: aminotransferase class V-fold PLP-dependent enzyme, partial [Erysipelotrichales bacterium]|nr:aminotransferase class V-fold PLP-dependent enzyme [Erysipelotrichales bacterium]